jgi:hypothetical protein
VGALCFALAVRDRLFVLKKPTMSSPATHEALMATMMTNSVAASSTISVHNIPVRAA